MTDEELWRTVCHPLPPPVQYTSPRAPLTLKAFALLGFLAVIGGTLWALNN